MIPPPAEPERIKIMRHTFLKVDPELDEEFEGFLSYMGITFEVKEDDGEIEWPLVEYEGNPQAIKSMLSSRFGMGDSDMEEEYPQLFS